MKIFLLVFLVLILIVLLGFAGMTILLFRKVVVRMPYCSTPGPDEAQDPIELSKDWEPYREVFQEGKRTFCQADRERVTIQSYDGVTLVGHLLWPDNSEDDTARAEGKMQNRPPVKGCLLLMHGFHGSPCHDFGPIIPFYLKQGYALLMAEERAHGESGGRYITYGIKERYDCRDWCVCLADRFGPDMPIFLDGISMGASVVLMASALSLPDNVRGIIADCGYTSPYDIMKHVLRNGMHLPVFPILPMAGLLCRICAGFGLKEYSTVEALKENHLPVLFVHGLADAFVPSRMTEENFAACTAPKKVMYVEGAGHGLSYLMEKCETCLSEFLETYGQNQTDQDR